MQAPMRELDLLRSIHWETLIATWGARLLSALAIFLVGLWIARWLTTRLLPRTLERTGTDAMLVNFLRNVAYIAGLVIVVIAALGTLGVQTASLLTVIGAAGLAVGLALKDSLSNIASGVMLVTLRPFRAGDVVTVAGQTGMVEEVRIFHTVLNGPDKQRFTIPNNLITAAPIVNLTAQPIRRIELVIGIGYGDDIETARRAALEVMRADERVLADPEPDVLVYELGDNAVNLGIRCFVSTPDWFPTKMALQEKIKLAFDRAGVNIPYPQRDMHLHLRDTDGKPIDLQALMRGKAHAPSEEG